MSKTAVYALIFVIMMFSGLFYMQPLKAQYQNSVIINSDGSVTPSTAPIQRIGNTYVLTSNLNVSLIVERGNIVVDGANYTLQGEGESPNGTAVTLMASNVTVENLQVADWKAGVYGAYNNNTIAHCQFIGNYQGVALYADDYVVFGNSIAGSSDVAFLIVSGANNFVAQNQIVGNRAAFDIVNGSQTRIVGNNVTENSVILTLATNTENTLLYANDFVNNSAVLVIPFGGPTLVGWVPVSPAGEWDNGTVGNFWSDYATRYPNATEIGKTGVGNTPYVVKDSTTDTVTYANGTSNTQTVVLGIGVDHYPLMAASSTSILNSSPTVSPSSTSISSNASPSPPIPEFSYYTAAILFVLVTSVILVYWKRKGKAS